MRKKCVMLSALLAITALLGACGKQAELSAPQISRPAEEVTEKQTDEPEAAVILEQAQNLDGGLWYVPNEAVEAASWPVLEGFRGNLLLSQAENSDGINADMHTTLIDSHTGQTLAETIRPMPNYQMPQALDSMAALLEGNDPMTVTFLDEHLETVSSVTVDGPCLSCYLRADGKILYTMAYDRGITAVDLATGTREELLSHVTNLDAYTACGIYVPIAYDDIAASMRVYASLNLETGQVEQMPFQESCSRLMRWNDLWLSMDYDDSTLFAVGTDARPDYLRVKEGGLQLLENGNLFGSSYVTGAMAVYEADGHCLASAVLPEELQLNTGAAPVWSEPMGGYFLLAFDESRNSRLLFWDVSIQTGKEQDLERMTWEERHRTPGGESVEPALYAAAEAISERYGITVAIADQCVHAFPDFTYTQLHDGGVLKEALACLDRALSRYPQGMLAQLGFGSVREIEIYLAAELEGGTYFGSERTYHGFAAEDGSAYYIVLDAAAVREGDVFHELSHLIDRKLSYASSLRPDACYSEGEWLKRQPEGFEFTYDYTEIPPLTEAGQDWFIDAYSQSFPTEDRARIMEYAMREDTWEQTFRESPHLMEKLRYYSASIRDCFDTAGWPETACWERPLQTNG